MDEKELLLQVKELPGNPGVYRYYDSNSQLLYIGKAKNLKKRVSSYFVPKNQYSSRIRLLVKNIRRIEYTIVNSEKDALLLENSLIKEYQPKFNISLKDDKTFPFIKIVNERFPRIFLTRKQEKDGSEYFGPYTSVGNVRALFEMIIKQYPIRNCTLHLSAENIRKKKYKVCLEYHLGNCYGPCEGLQTIEDYDLNIASIKKILSGKISEVQQLLKEKIQEHTNALEFEQADVLFKRLQNISEYISKSTIVNPKLGNLEVFGWFETEKKAYISYMSVSEGTIIRTNIFTVNKDLNEKEEILSQAILTSLDKDYDKHELIVPFQMVSLVDARQTVPLSGDKKKLLALAYQNAMQAASRDIGKPNREAPHIRILQQMKEDLKLSELPYHIECFDNSNFQGAYPVASMVVFKNAKPSNKDYRHYNIKTVVGPDDFASMEEIVYRRYKRLLDENKELPQLIVIDGGKGQLSAAIESLQKLGIYEKVQVISIAKRLEEIYFPNDPFPLHIHKKSESLKVLQNIRNEAHRFAITFHRNQRQKGTVKTDLTNIPGIGTALSEKLLKAFKSVKKLKEASLPEIEKVVGKQKTKLIIEFLKNK